MNLTYDLISRRIDHSLLQPTLTDSDLEDGCRLAAEYGVASVCIKPTGVILARSILERTRIKVGTVIGFPHGGNATVVKVYESERAIGDGATELDAVVNIGRVISGDWRSVSAEIQSLTEVAHAGGAIIKVIFENCYLSDDQKVRLCQICGEHSVDYVKTSTGYGSGGATEADLTLMRRSSPPGVKLKAAGGIRDLDGAIRAVEIGCDRLGLSRTAEILDALKARLEGRPEKTPTVPRGTGGY